LRRDEVVNGHHGIRTVEAECIARLTRDRRGTLYIPIQSTDRIYRHGDSGGGILIEPPMVNQPSLSRRKANREPKNYETCQLFVHNVLLPKVVGWALVRHFLIYRLNFYGVTVRL
jgi:hypothetical protein